MLCIPNNTHSSSTPSPLFVRKRALGHHTCCQDRRRSAIRKTNDMSSSNVSITDSWVQETSHSRCGVYQVGRQPDDSVFQSIYPNAQPRLKSNHHIRKDNEEIQHTRSCSNLTRAAQRPSQSTNPYRNSRMRTAHHRPCVTTPKRAHTIRWGVTCGGRVPVEPPAPSLPNLCIDSNPLLLAALC
jgi:hypothetical protein